MRRIRSRPTKSAPVGSLPTARSVPHAEFDPEDIRVFPCPSFLASLFENILAVINIPVIVMLKSANCRHPLSISNVEGTT